jgi:DNA-binding PadR family transcriptional regulator
MKYTSEKSGGGKTTGKTAKPKYSSINGRSSKTRRIAASSKSQRNKHGPKKNVVVREIENYVFNEWAQRLDLKMILDFRILATLTVTAFLGRDGTFASAAEMQTEIKSKGKVKVPLASLYLILETLEIKGLISTTMVQTKGRPKAVYQVTALGHEVLSETVRYHQNMAAKMPRKTTGLLGPKTRSIDGHALI